MRYDVDLDELGRVIDSLDAFADQLDDRLHALDGATRELHLTWQGEAATAQAAAHAQLTRGAREVHQALVAMHAHARAAHEHYHAAAVANVETWRPLL